MENLGIYLHDFQGERLVIANVGDSRAVLATTSEDGTLEALQLTIDFRPNLPRKFSNSKFTSESRRQYKTYTSYTNLCNNFSMYSYNIFIIKFVVVVVVVVVVVNRGG